MNQLQKKNRYFLSLLSGLLMAISFPFTGSLTLLIFVSWVPLLLVEREISLRNYRSSKLLLHAYIAFLTYNIGTTWWIWFASPGGVIMAVTLNSLLMSLAFFLFHYTKKILGSKIGYFSFFIYWMGFEYIHHYWELSWPWLTVGNSFSIFPELVQWYSVTGITGGTLWVLLVNFFVFKVIENVFFKQANWKKQRLLIGGILSLIIVPALLSLALYSNYTEKKNPLEVVVLQPNIDPYNEKFVSSMKGQLDKLFALADKTVRPTTDIVIAPETAISQGFFEEEFVQLPFYQYIKQRKDNWGQIAFYTGASTARFFKKPNSRASRILPAGGYYEGYNSSLLMDEQNGLTFLHKSKLVLGVEKIPFSNWIPYLEELSINNGGTSGTLGIEKEPKVISSEKVTFAPLICYESIYGEFNAAQCKKGAEVIFVITNDGWWQDTPGYKQHMSFSRLRAVENRRSVARSANTGISCFINQRGDVFQETKWWTSAAIRQKINKNNELTFFSKHGDILGRTSAFSAVLLVLLTFYRKLKKLIVRS
jgi:apolipoprotein N-acyltransferase